MKPYLLAPLLSSAALLGACATTDPLTGGSMQYRLPRTDAVPTLTLTLKDCTTLAIDAELKIAPKPGAQASVYEIKGEQLASARIKRSLKLVTNAGGVLTGINAGVSERSPQIAANYLKLAAQVLPLLLSDTNVPLRCNPATEAAADRAKVIRGQIDHLRRLLVIEGTTPPTPNGPSALARERMKDLLDLTTELGALDGILTIDVPGEITLPDAAPSGVDLEKAKNDFASAEAGRSVTPAETFGVKLSQTPFQKWFGPGADVNALAKAFSLQWRAIPVDRTPLGLTRNLVNRGLRECRVAMATPRAAEVQILVWGTGTITSPIKKKITTYVGQWSPPGELCLDAGFGESRAIELAFDDFGRTTTYGWSSEATAESISGAVGGAAADIGAVAKGFRGPTELEMKKAEIDELETNAKLNALRACRDIRAAGGICPKE